MAREQGTFTQSANYELQKEGTIDARQFVDVFADLLTFTASNYIADGFPVTVRQDSVIGGITYKRGWYQFLGGAVDEPNNWEFMGGSDTPTLQEVIDADGGGYLYASFPSGAEIEDDGAGLRFSGEITMESVSGHDYILANNSGLFVGAENSRGDNGDFLVNVGNNGKVGWRKLLDDTVTSLTKLWSSKKISSELDSKVDKEVGKGLSQENYTTAEKDKLAGLESSKFLGLYPSESALTSAHPNAIAGNYADVDAGIGIDTIRYVWDVSDAQWVQSGSGAPLTPAQIKQMYESNPDTNAFTDSLKSWLQGMTEQFTTALKNSYDSAVTWISTNGQNVLDHINSPHAPANAQKNSDITKGEIEDKLTGNITTHTHTVDAYTKLEADEKYEQKQVKEEVYGTIALMLFSQGDQYENQTIRVNDASADTNLIFPTGANKVAYYKYDGVAGSPASIADYTLISAPYSNHNGDTFDPDNYDLDEFKNESTDPYVRNSNLPSPFDPTYLENDIQTLENTKQDNLGFTPENVGNKATTLAGANNTTYPTTKTVADELAPKLIIKTANFTINPINDNQAIIINKGFTCTINPNLAFTEGFSVAMLNDSNTSSSIVLQEVAGVQYKVNRRTLVDSGTIQIDGGVTCTIVFSLTELKFYLNGTFV